jgi:hypothetical protein
MNDPCKKIRSLNPVSRPIQEGVEPLELKRTPQPSMACSAISQPEARGKFHVHFFKVGETTELEIPRLESDRKAQRDLMAMREWTAMMSLAEARRHLDTVIDELIALGGEEAWPLPECPRCWNDRQWLTARRIALQSRVMQRLSNGNI